MSPDFESLLQSTRRSRLVVASGAVPSLFQAAGDSDTDVEWSQTPGETGGENDSGTGKPAWKFHSSRAANRSTRRYRSARDTAARALRCRTIWFGLFPPQRFPESVILLLDGRKRKCQAETRPSGRVLVFLGFGTLPDGRVSAATSQSCTSSAQPVARRSSSR